MIQTEIQFKPVASSDQDRLRAHLYAHGWQTRRQLSLALTTADGAPWSERMVREVAESLGSEIVRGQPGFKLMSQIQKRSDDFLLALQAADAAISQGKKMIRYGLGLKRRLHALV